MKAIIGLFAVLFIVIIVTISAIHSNNFSVLPKTSTVSIDGNTFTVDQQRTPAQWQQGLSGRKNMASNHGMLFIFPKADYQQFWMKQMLFPLDMVFINNNKIVTIYQNVPAPAANTPDTSLPVYGSTQPANRVLELNAGITKKDGIKVGDTVTYSL